MNNDEIIEKNIEGNKNLPYEYSDVVYLMDKARADQDRLWKEWKNTEELEKLRVEMLEYAIRGIKFGIEKTPKLNASEAIKILEALRDKHKFTEKKKG
jgi:hypothetical protein